MKKEEKCKYPSGIFIFFLPRSHSTLEATQHTSSTTLPRRSQAKKLPRFSEIYVTEKSTVSYGDLRTEIERDVEFSSRVEARHSYCCDALNLNDCSTARGSPLRPHWGGIWKCGHKRWSRVVITIKSRESFRKIDSILKNTPMREWRHLWAWA